MDSFLMKETMIRTQHLRETLFFGERIILRIIFRGIFTVTIIAAFLYFLHNLPTHKVTYK